MVLTLEFGQEDQRMPQKMLLNGTAKAIATGTKHSLILMEAGMFVGWDFTYTWMSQEVRINGLVHPNIPHL